LCPWKERFNGDGNCRSFGNYQGYTVLFDGNKNMLTNMKDENFTISELEVWKVKYEDE
jgi:hypothetical protein